MIRIRNRASAACTFILGTCALAQGQWALVWSDEFDGNALDTSSWEYQIGNGMAYGLPDGWGNNELQYYTNFTNNLNVSGGTLKIIAREQSFGGKPYTSARIRTLGMREFLYGRIEARIKLPSTSGVWPAFWMLPTNSPYGGWASSGEMDVLESVNDADRIYGTIHFGSQFPNNQSNGGSFADGTDFSQAFHVYAMEWDPDEIKWFVDGNLYHTVTSAQWFSSAATGNPRAPFDVPFHLLLNVAVGGNFPGSPDGSAVFPQTLEVDYVRVFERAQTPFGGVPHPIPGLVEAEDFDEGIEGQSYHDCEEQNFGGQYRDTGVDIQASTEGGYNVGWICEGEWLEYTVDVAQAGMYRLEARVSSLSTGGEFRIEVNGEDRTGHVTVPSTGGWQSWQTVAANIMLNQGQQVIRFVNTGSVFQSYNLNWLSFSTPAQCSPADLVEPFGVLNFFDIAEYLALFSAGDPSADLNADGELNFFDVSEYLSIFAAGCP